MKLVTLVLAKSAVNVGSAKSPKTLACLENKCEILDPNLSFIFNMQQIVVYYLSLKTYCIRCLSSFICN